MKWTFIPILLNIFLNKMVMEYIILIIFLIIFLIINYKIVISDLLQKKIPNKQLIYLLFLIPFWFVFLFFFWNILYSPEINIIFFIFQIFVSLLISFLLYYFWIWSAWDAKYLLVLALFIPYIWIVSFIWNIGLITLAYLIWYFFWFYFWKVLFNSIYRKSLFKDIKSDLSEKWYTYKKSKSWSVFFIIFKFLLIFLIIFVSIRLLRLYSFSYIFHWNSDFISNFTNFFHKYHFYLVISFIAVFIILLILIRKTINKSKKFLKNKVFSKYEKAWFWIEFTFIFVLFILLISFCFYEYFKNSQELFKSLYLIFTLYISLYLFLRMVIYSYKITFWLAETDFIRIEKLEVWNIVDKPYLQKLFWTQQILGYSGVNEKENENFFDIDPENYFNNIENPIDEETKMKLQKIYFCVNNYHMQKQTPEFQEITAIKILRTFSFAPYIFLWFTITTIFWNNIINFLFDKFIEIINK